jgi:hypothetical protein
VFREACRLGCEGIVSKRLGSPYRSGRSAHWVKVKNPKAPGAKREARSGRDLWRTSQSEMEPNYETSTRARHGVLLG